MNPIDILTQYYHPQSRAFDILVKHGKLVDQKALAAALLDGIVKIVRSKWRPIMRREGVSETDCETIASAFLYDGFFYEQFA